MTLRCPRFRCAQPMEEDRVFARDAAFQHVAKRRFVCRVCGHDLVLEPDPASVPLPPPGWRCCDVCGELLGTATMKRRHPGCSAAARRAKVSA